jgi:hypothetical protein
MVLPHIGEPLLGDVLGDEFSSCCSASASSTRGRLHLVDQAAAAVGALVPGVHGVEHGVALVDDEHGALDARREVGAGHDHGDLEQALLLGVEAAHLAVEPDQVLVAFSSGWARGRGRRVKGLASPIVVDGRGLR